MPSRPTQPKVTFLYDTRLPVSLRLRGFGTSPVFEVKEATLRVLGQTRHPASQHVLALRTELMAPVPVKEKTSKKKQNTVQDFDAFAKE
ncbi:MAG: hypothetical protein UY81_C0031G0008, partial [Candidatus Giovannonibacteria bacterium GW2011_GWA2_53_7]